MGYGTRGSGEEQAARRAAALYRYVSKNPAPLPAIGAPPTRPDSRARPFICTK
jgi:hypothetical protein